MNSLSWLIYAADVTGTVNVLSLVLFIPTIPAAVATLLAFDDNGRTDWDQRTKDSRLYPTLYPNPPGGERPELLYPLKRYFRPLVAAAVVLGTINIATPSRETMYAVAASQMGERVLKSDTANKALTALNAWLDKQIAKPAGGA